MSRSSVTLEDLVDAIDGVADSLDTIAEALAQIQYMMEERQYTVKEAEKPEGDPYHGVLAYYLQEKDDANQ